MSLNLAECLDSSASAAPDRTAIIFDALHMSYGELAAAAKRVASALYARGIRPGDRVGIILPNTPHFPIVYYGILYAGATAVPMNVLLKRREIQYRLHDASIRALFAYEPIASEAIQAFDLSPACEHLILVEPGMEPCQPTMGESFLRMIGAASPEFDMVQTMPDDVAVIIYASAMDGKMKGAQLTHFNLFQNALTIKEYALGYRPDDVCITVLPLFHGFGQTTMMNAPFMAQATVTLVPMFEPNKVLEVVQRDRVTLLALVPTMFHLLYHYKRASEFDLSSLRVAITGGSAMPKALSEQFTARFGIPVLEGYGLTETSPVVSWNGSAESNRLGSLGRPIWGVRMAILREDGAFAAPGEVGEILVRGHCVMKGYLNRPDANEEVFRNGWFHTGDLGYCDADGYYYFTGVKKDMINRAGMNVYPREVENTLREHPAVQDVVVIGMPEPARGEEVVACVVLYAGTAVSGKEIIDFCRTHIAAYKAPRRVEFMESLPKDPAGVTDKSALRKQLMGT